MMSHNNTAKNRRATRLGLIAAALRSLLSAFLLLLAAPSAFATDEYFNSVGGTAGANYWSVISNWSTISGGTVVAAPGASDTAIFNLSSINGATVVPINADQSVGGMIFNNTGTTNIRTNSTATRTLTIGSGGITVNSGAGFVSFATTSRPLFVALSASQTWLNNGTLTVNYISANATTLALGTNTLTLDGSGTTNIEDPITGSGAAAIIKNGSGNLTLSGANTYTGSTTINAGNLNISGSGTLGAISGNLTVAGGILEMGGTSQTKNVVSFTGGTTQNGTLTASSFDGQNGTVTAILAGTGAVLTKNSTGTLTLSGVNTYTGTTTINAGTLQTKKAAALPSYSTGTVTVNNAGSVLALNAGAVSGEWTSAEIDSLLANTSVTFAAGTSLGIDTTGGSFSYASNITKANMGLVKSGANTLTLGGTNTYTGGTTINAGTLLVNSTASLGNTSGSLTFGGTSTLQLGATFDTSRNYAINTGVTATINTVNFTQVNSGVISGAGSLTKLGTGTLTLNGTNSYTGTTTISAGTLQLGNGGTTGSLSTSSAIVNNANLTFARSNTITQGTDFANSISGTGSLTLDNISGTLVLTGTNSYTGQTLISRGTATVDTLADFGTNSSLGAGTAGTAIKIGLSSTSSTLIYTGGAISTNRTVQIGSGSGVAQNGGATINNNGSGALVFTAANFNALDATATTTFRRLTLGGSNSGEIQGIIGNNNGITSIVAVTKADAGTWILSGANTYTGNTTISAGTLQIGNGSTSGSLSTSGAISNNGTLAFNRSNTITQGTDFASVISGTGNVTQSGAGTLVLSGTNTYSGVTTLTSGTLNAGAVQAFGTNSTPAALTLNGGTLDLATDTSVNAYKTTVGGSVTIASNRATSGAGITHTLGTLSIGANTLSITAGANATGTTAGVTFGATTFSATPPVFDVATGVTLTLGALQTAGDFTKQGSGTLVLSTAGAAARSSGATTLTEGKLTIAATGTRDSLGSAATTLVLNGGTLDLATDASAKAHNTTVGGNVMILSDKATAASAGITHTLGTLSIGAQTLTINSGTNVGSGTAVLAFGATTMTGASVFTVNDGVSSNTTLTLASLANGGNLATFNGSHGDTTVTGAISGAGGLTMSGTGVLTLNGATTFTGDTLVNAGGTLALNNASALGNSILDTASGAGTLTTNQTTLTIGGLTGSGNLDSLFGTGNYTGVITALTLNSTVTNTYSGVIADGATGMTLTKNGTGTQTLAGANSYTGLTTINAGTLKLGNAAALGTTAAGTTVASGAELDLNGQAVGAEAVSITGTGISSGGALINSSGTNATLSGVLTLAGTASIGGTGNLTLSSGLAGNQILTKEGAGTLTLQAAATRAGSGTITTTINGGTISISNALAMSTGATHLTIINSGGVLELAGEIIHDQVITLNTGGTVRSAGTNDEDGKITVAASASATLSTVGVSDVFTVGQHANDITGGEGATLSIAGPGTVLLGAASNYTGSWSLNTGTLKLGSNTALGTGALTINGGTTIDVTAARTTNNVQNWNGNFTFTGTSTWDTGTGAVTMNASRTLTVNGIATSKLNMVVGGVLSDSGGNFSLTKSGTGAITLAGANTYTGGTIVSSGNLYTNNANALGTGLLTFNGGNQMRMMADTTVSGVVVQADAGIINDSSLITNYLTIGSSGIAIDSPTARLTIAGTTRSASVILGASQTWTNNSSSALTMVAGSIANTLNLGAYTLTLNGSGTGGFEFNAPVIGTGGIIKNGTGTLTLTNANTYTGDTRVNTGTVALNNASALGNSIMDTDGAGTFTTNQTTLKMGGLKGNGDLVDKITAGFSAVTAITLNSTATNTYSGVIADGSAARSLTKQGTGTQILSGANTYSGATNVTGGTLLVNGNQSAATGTVTVASGATLGGNGTLGGATTVTGILSPGNGNIGTLTTGSLTWNGAAAAGPDTNWIFDLGASGESDLLAILGNFNKGTGSVFNFQFANVNSGTFTLVHWTGSSNFLLGDFTSSSLGGGLTGSFTMDTNNLYFTAVPEPSTWVGIAALVLTGGVMTIRRRTNKLDGHPQRNGFSSGDFLKRTGP